MVVSGLIVYTKPESLDYVKTKLDEMENVEVHRVIEDHKIVIVIEADTVDDEVETSKRISEIEGVLGVNLVYHHFGE